MNEALPLLRVDLPPIYKHLKPIFGLNSTKPTEYIVTGYYDEDKNETEKEDIIDEIWEQYE